jgi:hypothetical protein
MIGFEDVLNKLRGLDRRIKHIELIEKRIISPDLESRLDQSLDDDGNLRIGSPDTLIISNNAITITQNQHRVDTEGGAATDYLDTINGGEDGFILVLRSLNGARDTTLRDGQDNIRLAGDFTLNSINDTIMLLKTGSYWRELSRSNN